MKLNKITNIDLIKLMESGTELFKNKIYHTKDFVEKFIGLGVARSGFYGQRLNSEDVVPLPLSKTDFSSDENIVIQIEGIILLDKMPVNFGIGSIQYVGYGLLEVDGIVKYDGRASAAIPLITSDDITNVSTVAGVTVSDALETLDSEIDGKAAVNHASTHTRGQADEILGDTLLSSYVPSSWTPSIPEIGAQLAAIDTAIGNIQTNISNLDTDDIADVSDYGGANVTATLNLIKATLDQINPGGGSSDYQFSVNTSATDPGAGVFKYNNADPSLATEVYMSKTDFNGLDVTPFLASVEVNDLFLFSQGNNANKFNNLVVTGPIIDNVTWVVVPVMSDSSGALHDDTALCTLSIILLGIPNHASDHETGGNDAIDGDKLDSTFTPTNYTPTAATTKGQFEGIDNELGNKSDNGHTHQTTEISIIAEGPTAHDLNLHKHLGHMWSSSIDQGGFDFTDHGDGTVSFTAGVAYARTSNSEEAPIVLFDTPAVANLALPDNATSYIYASYNGGSPIVTATTNPLLVLGSVDLPVAYVICRVGTTLHILDVKAQAHNYMNNANVKDAQVNGFERAAGGAITITGSNELILGAATFYLFNRPIQTPDLDTSDTGVFTTIYQDGVGGWTRVGGQTILPIDEWDDGSGTPQNAGNGEYINLWIHVVHNNPAEYVVLLGQAVHASLQAALDEGLPPNRSPELAQYSTGDELYQVVYRGNGSLEATVDLKATIGKAVSGFAGQHNELNTLQGGQIDEYYHCTAAEYAQVQGLGALSQKDTVATPDIEDGAVTNIKQGPVAQNRIKGRFSTGTGSVEDLTAAQTKVILNYAVSEMNDVTITGAVHGDIFYYNGTQWVNLGAGTDGQILQTQGPGSAPVWIDQARQILQFDYRATTSTQSPAPASGRIIWNNATQASSTQIFIHETDLGGTTINNILDSLAATDEIFLFDPSDSNVFQKWKVNGNTNNGTYVTIDVTFDNGTKSFFNNELITMLLSFEGTSGSGGLDDGDYGDIVVSGTGTVMTIDANVVSDDKLADMNEGLIKGRALGTGSGDPQNLAAATVQAIIAPPRTESSGSSSTITPALNTTDTLIRTALAVNLTVNVPTGTADEGRKFIIRLKDNGTSRTITWNAIYRAIGVTLPTATTANKTLYIGIIYNATDAKWDVVAVKEEA